MSAPKIRTIPRFDIERTNNIDLDWRSWRSLLPDIGWRQKQNQFFTATMHTKTDF